MNPVIDRSAPGVRITLLPDEKAGSGEPLDLGSRLVGFTFDDRSVEGMLFSRADIRPLVQAELRLWGGHFVEAAIEVPIAAYRNAPTRIDSAGAGSEGRFEWIGQMVELDIAARYRWELSEGFHIRLDYGFGYRRYWEPTEIQATAHQLTAGIQLAL